MSRLWLRLLPIFWFFPPCWSWLNCSGSGSSHCPFPGYGSDELARQRAAHATELHRVGVRQCAHARELRRNHGGALATDIARILGINADSLRREVEYLRSQRERKQHWTGEIVETPLPEAMRKADELERRAEQIEQERDAITALQFARISPQAIERDIRARVKALGFNVKATTEQAGWKAQWEAKPKTKAA